MNSGVKALIIAQANSEGSGLVVKANSGIHNLEDLVNKTVATPGESSIQFLLLKIALDREGLDLKIKT
jgi:NitT/TauT family transport system substrate-binding protein